MLKSGSPKQISTMYSRLNNDTKQILNGITQLAYHMNGGMTYNQILFTMSYVEREIAMDFVNKRLEAGQ